MSNNQNGDHRHNQQRTCNLPWLSNADIHNQVLLIAFLVRDLQTDCLPDIVSHLKTIRGWIVFLTDLYVFIISCIFHVLSLRCLLIVEDELALLCLVVFSFLCCAVLGVVWDGNLATSSRDTLQFQFKGANRLNNLNLSIVKAEDTTVVVVKDHDGGHVGCSKLDAGLHLSNSVFAGHRNLREMRKMPVVPAKNYDL